MNWLLPFVGESFGSIQLSGPARQNKIGFFYDKDFVPIVLGWSALILLALIAVTGLFGLSGLMNFRMTQYPERGDPADKLNLLNKAPMITDVVYQQIEEGTDQHLRLLRKYRDYYRELGFRHSAQLAAGELFTEKAQTHLTKRANDYYVWAVFNALCSALALCAGVFILLTQNTPELIGEISSSMRVVESDGGNSWPAVVVYMFRGVAVAGFFAGAIYFFASLSRAYFHEGTVLLNRRHATRLGRLFLMIKFGEPDFKGLRELFPGASPSMSFEKAAEVPYWVWGRLDIQAKELEEAFGWNLSQDTAFKDIKPEKMSTSLYVKMVEALGSVADKAKSDAETRTKK